MSSALVRTKSDTHDRVQRKDDGRKGASFLQGDMTEDLHDGGSSDGDGEDNEDDSTGRADDDYGVDNTG